MRTLHVGLRVADRERSVAFYGVLGYEVVGEVPWTPMGHLTMLKLPGDDFIAIELVHDPDTPIVDGNALSRVVIQVDSMDTVLGSLRESGIAFEPPTSPDGSKDFLTAMIGDPDGNRIELVQWPPGHPVGMSIVDFGA